MIRLKRFFLMVAIAFITLQMVAQENNSSLRPAIKVEKAFSERFSLQLEHETRYYTNLKEFERFTTSLGADYSFTKNWSAGLTYLWLYQNNIKENLYASRNRFDLSLKYKTKIGDWNFSISEKFRTTYYDESKENQSYSPKNVLFTKGEVAYNIKPVSLTPYINGQLRYAVNHPTKNAVNQYRWSVGAKYKINKLLGVDLYFEQRGDMNADKPGRVRIIGTALKFTI